MISKRKQKGRETSQVYIMLNSKVLWVLILVNVFYHSTSASTFNLTEITTNKETLEIGDDLEIICKETDYFKFCRFFHNEKNCTFEWSKDVWNLTHFHCHGKPFGQPADFYGNYDNTTCGIKVSNVTKEQAGNWTCQLEDWHESGINGTIVSRSIVIEVVENQKDSNPSTTNSETTKMPNGKLLSIY